MKRSEFLKSAGLAAAISIVQPMNIFARTPIFNATPDLLFKDGDTVMFLGDSITHNGKWHTFIRNFYLSSYPERRISYINSGVTGDSTGTVLARMDEDVLQHRPTVVVVLLGMNNTGGSLAAFDQQMNAITDRLARHCNPKFIYCTTTIYDETAQLERVAQTGKNEMLAKISESIRKRAKSTGSLLVEFYAPMMELNARMQKGDPAYTIIGPDRVHPLLDGHLLMAYYFLKAQHAEAHCSELVLSWNKEKTVAAHDVQVSNLNAGQAQLSFVTKETMLPFPIPPAIKRIADWAPVQNELNRQLLRFDDLPEGTYQLFIDQTAAGIYSRQELKAGINLGNLQGTPQYQQAMRIYVATMLISDKAGSLRTLLKVKQMLKKDNINKEDAAALEAYKIKQAKILPFYGIIIGTYIEYKDKEAQILQEINEVEQSLPSLCEIKNHHYLIKKIKS